MCGRKYASEELSWAEYREILDITGPAPDDNFPPNWNIAPTHMVPVGFMRDGAVRLERLQWGLIPHWANDARIGAKMINARIETLTEKPSFRGLLADNRCVIPVSGYYEWHRSGNEKRAFRIAPKSGEPLLLAGLWTCNKRLDIASYTVITKAANSYVSAVHHRMPLLLSSDEVERWLNAPAADAEKLSEGADIALDMVEIGPEVGNVRNNYPELIEPIGGST